MSKSFTDVAADAAELIAGVLSEADVLASTLAVMFPKTMGKDPAVAKVHALATLVVMARAQSEGYRAGLKDAAK